jgi:hypothetical protein
LIPGEWPASGINAGKANDLPVTTGISSGDNAAFTELSSTPNGLCFDASLFGLMPAEPLGPIRLFRRPKLATRIGLEAVVVPSV